MRATNELILKFNALGAFVVIEKDGIKQEKAISFDDLGNIFAKSVQVKSPLSLGNSKVLAYSSKEEHESFILADVPRIRNIKCQTGYGESLNTEFFNIPMPGIILKVVFHKTSDSIVTNETFIYTYLGESINQLDFLYKCPTNNVYPDCHICWGKVKLGKKDTDNLIGLFFGSAFNNDLGHEVCKSNILELYGKINNSKVFPQEELIPTRVTLLDLYKNL